MIAFALCGGLAAFGGVLLAGYSGKAAQSMGDAYLLPAIAAVVLGGTSILGGRGNYLGTVAGAILSSSRVGVKVKADVGIPILFLHHRRDGCSKANPAADVDIYEALRASGKTDVDFAWVDGGTAGSGDACHAGHHMFLGSEEDAYRAVDRFVAGH